MFVPAVTVNHDALLAAMAEYNQTADNLDAEVVPVVPTNVCTDTASASFIAQARALDVRMSELGHRRSADLRRIAQKLQIAKTRYTAADRGI
ncbi:hypothetical protein MB901379_03059 [Mycobacterium basiliense]|uniref:PE family protein n=1 Tax=Mycobacterium basiliense TaxID=2094119 RepID=A0A3S4DUI9_9MYCO|nr:hypothetical protein MB901379_03059 [Mycobacterium basiliense]